MCVCLFYEFSSSFYNNVISPLNRDKFSSTPPSLNAFISFSDLTALAIISSTMLSSSGERGHPYHISVLGGKLLAFHH